LSTPNGIVTVDPNNREHVLAAATLHETLLSHSPIPRLGSLFMTRFFYTSLVKDGLIHCYLYRSGGQYVGFLSITEKPFSFMNEGKRSHVVRLAVVLGLAVLQKPARVRILFETLAAGRRRPTGDNGEGIGEVLSVGVLEQFRAQKDANTGLRISHVLFDEGIRHFRQRGFRRIEANVDGDNLRAIRFYRSYGAVVEKSPLAWPSDSRIRLDL
jgi:ribosomal protein S18 acetylase RimI-like enzyme